MLKDIAKIGVLGAIFDQYTMFDIFKTSQNNTSKGALLYGKNGSGKSTIAKAFRKISGEDIESIVCANIHDECDSKIILTEEEKKHIFVFDEDYIDNNVKFREDHLDTIVMLGSEVDLTEKIEIAESELNTIYDRYMQQETKYKAYCDSDNILSPKYHLLKIMQALRGDECWAGRERIINGSRINASVKEDTYETIINSIPKKTKAELLQDYNDKIKELEEARAGSRTINNEVPLLSNLYHNLDEKHLNSLLEKIIDKPELSEREKKLLSLLHNKNIEEVEERLAFFQAENTNECPFCFQPLTYAYKEALVASIEKILSKIVEEHQAELKESLLEPINLDLQQYNVLDSYQTCVDLIKNINYFMDKYNELLNQKIRNPYEAIKGDNFNISILINKLSIALKGLEEERQKYNIGARNTKKLSDELKRINSGIAYYEILDLVSQYKKQEKEESVEKEKLEKIKIEFQIKEKEIENLKAKKENVKLAIDSINACLTYIFFAENRLRIEYENGVYKLFSHEKSVKPCDVSVGERNIIGLSYFFISILEGQETNKAYENEYLIVIDDPISSYDIENRIGILSFLKYKISMFLEGNKDSKALIMTHDLKSFYDIKKILDEIMETCKESKQPKPYIYSCEMCNKELSDFKYRHRNEYTELIKTIYEYGKGEAKEYEPVIGNIMRQALEAFATFEYKRGIEKVSTDKKILDLLPKEYIPYYNNLMYRLVLHGGSHKEEQIKVMNDFDFFSTVSESEKIRTAKDVLCFIYLLNKRHLLEHLSEEKNSEKNLNEWCNSIKKRAVNL